MRKYVVLAALAAVLFLGCDTKYYTVSITNNSTKTVSYAYNGVSDNILLATKTKIYEVEAYTQPPKDYVDDKGIASVNMECEITGDYSFVDAEYYNLIVTNEFPFEITFSAGNFIENGGSMSVTADVDDTEKDTGAVIYTDKPKFTSTLSHPVVFEWEISGDDMTVTIK